MRRGGEGEGVVGGGGWRIEDSWVQGNNFQRLPNSAALGCLQSVDPHSAHGVAV